MRERCRPSEAARAYLDRLDESFELREGARSLQSPNGSLAAGGRIQAGSECRWLLDLAPELDLEEYCLRLASLEEDLSGDYLVFLTPRGYVADTPLRAFSAPGPRRHFHLALLRAEREGRLEDPAGIEKVMGEALKQPLRATPDGLYTLDDATALVARPLPDLPTLAAAARAVGLFLGACARNVLAQPFSLSGGRSPVCEYRVDFGTLRLEAGELAREALLSPAETALLGEAMRVLGWMARDPMDYPSRSVACWVGWASGPDDPASPAREAARRGRERRQGGIDEGRTLEEPELLRVWACAECHQLLEDFRLLEGFRPRHLEEARAVFRRGLDRDGPAVFCPCGQVLTHRSLQYMAYCQYFAWPGVDLHLEALRQRDGRLVPGWGRIDLGGGYEPLPGEPSPEALARELGRPFSLAAEWVRVMEAAEASGEVEATSCGALAWVAVFPPGSPEATFEKVGRLLAECPWDTTVVVHLSEQARLQPRPQGPGLRELAPRFAARLEDGTLGSAVVVDWPAFLDRVVEALRRDGLEPSFDPAHPGRIRLEDLRCWGTLDVLRELVGGLHAGLLPEDVAERAAAAARASLQEVGRVLQGIRALACPGDTVEVIPERRVLRVTTPGREPVEIGVDGLVSRWARDGSALERQVRYLLSRDAGSLEQCRCGEPSHLAVKLRSPEWLAALPEGQGQRLLRVRGGGALRLFVRECPHHVEFLEVADLERLGLEASDLESILRRDLDRTGARVKVLVGPDDMPLLAAFLGREAASLASHPSLVAGAFDAAGLVVEGKVDVAAPDLNLLLVTDPEAPRELVEAFEARALEWLQKYPGPGGPLGHRDTLVPGAPRGRIRVAPG